MSLAAYFIMIVALKPEAGLFDLICYGLASIISIAAILFYIAFLRTRNPAEKNILSQQILLNFYFKIPVHVQSFTLMIFKYVHTVRQFTPFEEFLAKSFVSQIAIRVTTEWTIAMYTLISTARLLLFLSPARFTALSTKFLPRIWLLAILTLFGTEVALSLTMFSWDKCQLTPAGFLYHELAFTRPNLNSSQVHAPSLKARISRFQGLTDLRYVAYYRILLEVIS